MVILGALMVILSLAMMFQPMFTWALELNDLRGCAFEVDPADYLFQLGNMNPGDSNQGTVTITKTGPSPGDIYFSFIHIDSRPPYPDDEYNLFDKLLLIIKQGDQVLYEGPMVGGASPGDPLLIEDFKYLISMVQGDVVLIDFHIILPGPTTGNEYQGAYLETELIFVSVCSGDPVPASLGDYVWIDTNSNGIQDAGEVGLNGVTVRLLDAGGNVRATTVTANDGTGNPGYYLFNNLAPGTYSVQFVLPSGYSFTIRNADGQGISGPLNSDVDPSTGRTAQVTLAAGNAVRYVDAGLIPLPVSRPLVNIEKYTNGVDADAPTGPFIPVGGAVTWTYVVTNTGNVPLRNVVVTDSRTEVSPVYVSGDTNGDNWLQVGEVWTYQATGIAVAGQYSNIGTVVGTPPTGPNVTDSDPSHYFGLTPDQTVINIEKYTNGVDADLPTGPQIAVGDNVTWTYVVTNPNTIPLYNIVVTDNRTGVNPVYISGDVNGDNVLQPGEVWIYRATGVAVAGQYSNVGSVTGVSANGKIVTDRDPSHYFGVEVPTEEVVEPEEPEVEPEDPTVIIIPPEGPKVDPPLPRTDGASVALFLTGFLLILLGMIMKKSLGEYTAIE